MKKVSIRIILYLLLVFSIKLNAQTNLEEIFKMQLYLNKVDVTKSRIDYSSFSNSVKIKLHTLVVKNELNIFQFSDYIFLKVLEAEIHYDGNVNASNLWCNSEHFYILAINLKEGTSYRLVGFELNDFVHFYNDLNTEYRGSHMVNLSPKSFLKKFSVEDINFNCLYKGSKSIIKDTNRFPCLEKCSDSFKISN